MTRTYCLFMLGILALAQMLGPTHVAATGAEHLQVLNAEQFAPHIQRFNAMEDENWTNHVSNAQSWNWLAANIPFFECPDREVEETYYYRWWSFRKHLKSTPSGFVFTEFLVPIGHAGAYNTISCAAGHHLMEGRWLRNQDYLDQYILFWLRGNDGKPQPHFHNFSSWFASAIYDRFLVDADHHFLGELLDDLVRDYEQWEKERRRADGLFWQFDVRDGMEESISGGRRQKNARPTINSYMFANARAIAAIAERHGQPELAATYQAKAGELKRLTQTALWDPNAGFFKVQHENGALADVREAIGFIPWYFNLPDPGREIAWAQLMDPRGFRAPYGLTTAERRHPAFRSRGCCGCEWDGAVWPFATSQTLVALANVLRDYSQSHVTVQDYFDLFLDYVRAHRFDGKPYIGEYLDEVTGHWLKGKQQRSRYYNHSTFAELVITGLAGLRPRPDETIEIHPLIPEPMWNWFCLDGVPYRGRTLTILWDADGTRYNHGPGLTLLVDGNPVARSKTLQRIVAKLPQL